MERYSEDLLKHLVKDKSELESWYRARYYIMKVLPPLDGGGIGVNSNKRVHIIIRWETPSDLLYSVIRQICLLTHYPNFNECTGANKTLITIVANAPLEIYNGIKECRYLGGLMDYCRCLINGEVQPNFYETIPLDIEFAFSSDELSDECNALLIEQESVEEKTKDIGCQDMSMDVTMGMLVNMVYNTGVEIDNLSAYDNANIERYSMALNVFCYKLKSSQILKKWNECAKPNDDNTYNEMDIKNKLSSVFCAECFDSRLRSVLDTSQKSLEDYLLNDFEGVMMKMSDERIITALARCEHSRWNVEKLIMGFTPLKRADWYEIESCFGGDRKHKIKELKKKGRHIDICSYNNLRRVNPSDMKYDYFLMLAMPQIMRSNLMATQNNR